jgi:hypothetical protein
MLYFYLSVGMALAGPLRDITAVPLVPDTIVAPLPYGTEVVVLGLEDPTVITAPSLGEINFPHPGFSEEDILPRLQNFALSHGANLIKVTADSHPTRHSAGRVAARVYRVADVRAYESWIDWSPGRRLTLADFKALPDSPNRSHSECMFYLSPEGYSRFYTRTSWIDRSAANPYELLLHEQGAFDLCELYRRKLDSVLSTRSFNSFNGSGKQSIYRQVYAEYLRTREQYDSATHNGLDSSQQYQWSSRIVAGDFPSVPILTRRQLELQARNLPPADHRALVYVIRPNQYNSPFWKRMVLEPYCVWPCPYFLFLNPESYSVTYHGVTQGPIGVRKFVYRYVQPDTCVFGSNKGDSRLGIRLEPGKVYYVKMKLIDREFLEAAHPEWELLTAQKGRRWLQKCRLSRHWEYFNLPVFPDPLR